MDAFLFDILIMVASYLAVAFFILFILNFQTVGFLFVYLRVKMSRGQLVLVRVYGKIQDYYRPGSIEEYFLIYKGKNKQSRRLVLPNGAVYRSMGVNCIAVDDEKNAVLMPNLEAISGFDAEKIDDLVTRALYKPSIMDDKTKILIALMVVIILGLGALGYFTHSWIIEVGGRVDALRVLAQPAAEEVAKAAVVGGA